MKDDVSAVMVLIRVGASVPTQSMTFFVCLFVCRTWRNVDSQV